MSDTVEKPPSQMLFFLGMAVLLCVFFAFLGRQYIFDAEGGTDPASDPSVKPAATSISRAAAAGICMSGIKQTLHDPGSAEFETSDNASISINGFRAFVQRKVRAKNGLGAFRKSNFSCLVEQRGDRVYPVLITRADEPSEQFVALQKEWGLTK